MSDDIKEHRYSETLNVQAGSTPRAGSGVSIQLELDLMRNIRDLEINLAKAMKALEAIARPKVGPDLDWTDDEVSRWREAWYHKYGEIARKTLAELTGGKDDRNP